jgi:hypothetical protein
MNAGTGKKDYKREVMGAREKYLMRMTKFYKMNCIDTKRREWFKLLGDDNTRCQYKIGQNTMDYVSDKDSNISFNLKGLLYIYARLCNANMYMQRAERQWMVKCV